MEIDSEIKCCGGAELHGLDSSLTDDTGAKWCKQALLEIYDEFGWEQCGGCSIDEGKGWIVMSTVVRRKPFINRGTARLRSLQDYVRRHKLGKVSIQRGTTLNPNSQNRLRTAMWHLDCEKIRRYVEKKEWRSPVPEKDGWGITFL